MPLHGDRFLIPREVWTEYANLVARLLPSRQAVNALTTILEGPFEIRWVLEPKELVAIVGMAQSVDQKIARVRRRSLSLVDLVVCAVAARFREGILTFDEGIKEAVRLRCFPGARLA